MDTRINAVIALLSSFSFHHVYAQQSRPNIIMILADDMGYSDIGCYGGEILTPNIDSLAREGVRMTQFYNTSRSCPTRASLMTGLSDGKTGKQYGTRTVRSGNCTISQKTVQKATTSQKTTRKFSTGSRQNGINGLKIPMYSFHFQEKHIRPGRQ